MKILHIIFYVKRLCLKFKVFHYVVLKLDSAILSKENAVQKDISVKSPKPWHPLTSGLLRAESLRSSQTQIKHTQELETSTCEDGRLRSHPGPGKVSALHLLRVQLSN